MFRTTASHPLTCLCCGPGSTLCLVWRALTFGLWPLLEVMPFSALQLLLEDHTPSPFSLFCPIVRLEAGSKHGFNAFTAERTWTAPGFYVRLQTFQALLTMCFPLGISTKSQDDGLRASVFPVELCQLIWDDEKILNIRVIHSTHWLRFLWHCCLQ